MIRASRLLVLFALLLAPVAFAADGDAPAPAAPATKPKLLVITFASLSGDVPARAGPKALGMLTQEFKSADSFQLVDSKKVGDKADTTNDLLTAARKGVDDAKELRSKRKFRLASEALEKSIAGFKQGAAGVTDVGEVVDAYALLAAVQYNTGKDDEGLKSLNAALTLAPDRELPLDKTSALFARLVADQRKVIKAAAKGQLTFESSPSGGAVTVDGIALGNTPIQVADVPAGNHFFKVALANGEVVGGTADVNGGKGSKVTATATNKDPESRILSAVAQNKLDADLVAAAKEATASMQADLIVFGALSKDGRGLALDSFLYAAQGNELRRLPRTQFDSELLSAGVEFYNLAGAVAQKGAQVGDPVKVPSSVSSGGAGAIKVAEAKYGITPGKDLNLDAESAEPSKDDPKKPLKRAPLKKK